MKKNKNPFDEIKIFILDIGMGTVMFIFISIITIGLNKLIYFLQKSGMENLLIIPLKFSLYALIGTNVILFTIYFIRSIYTFYKKINKVIDSNNSLLILNKIIIYTSITILILSAIYIILINYTAIFESVKTVLSEILKYSYSLSASILLISVFIILNRFFLKKIKLFISKEHSPEEVFQELFTVFITGVSNILLFTFTYTIFGISSSQATIKGDFITSLYFSIVTWTTLGYGDLKPIENLRLVASVEALMGYIYMTIIIGLFLNIVKIKVK